MPTLIVPAAGSSTRFPGYPPKWKIPHPVTGSWMVCEALRGMRGYDDLVLALRSDHIVHHSEVYEPFRLAGLREPRVVLIDKTTSQVDTVVQAIETLRINGPITVRDCDSAFEYDMSHGMNAVATSTSPMLLQETHPTNKCHMTVDRFSRIHELAEKKRITRIFAAGAYTFNDASIVLRGAMHGATYMSAVIQHDISAGASYVSLHVEGYEDWNTAEAWERYCARVAK